MTELSVLSFNSMVFSKMIWRVDGKLRAFDFDIFLDLKFSKGGQI